MQSTGDVNLDIDAFIATRAEDGNISSKSHIVTVFGDVISQHGGSVWLGSLIDALEPLGFSERLIRTSVFRLVKEDWLQASKKGRKSYYGFTDSANKHYTKAARRIYAPSTQHSDGDWLIVLPTFVPESQLISFKRQLRWLGFSTLASGAFAHPSIERSSLDETIKEMHLSDAVIIFESRTFDSDSNSVLKKLVEEKWNISELRINYQEFIDCYRPLLAAMTQGHKISDQQAFLIRTLVIHEYRRILLKDHELPENMLPEKWPGYVATQLVKKLYANLAKSSCRYIISKMQNIDGFLPKASNNFKQRFK